MTIIITVAIIGAGTILTAGFIVQGAYIRSLEKEIEAIKSWYPFCEILKIKIPEKDDFEWERKEE